MIELSNRLSQIIESSEAWLRAINDDNSGQPVLPGGWSRKELLAHLIESASNNHQRFVRAALSDSLDFPAYDTPGSVRIAAAEVCTWPLLIDLWTTYNRYLSHIIRHLPEDKLQVICRIGSNPPVTLQDLAEDYVTHLRHHLEQIPFSKPSM